MCARRDLPFGGNFAREIPSQIDACRLFLLILTESVYQSEHIENEVGIAFSRRNKKENIQIVPLELGDFTRKEWVQYYLIHTQSVKFPAQPDEQRIQRLVKRIALNLNPASKPQLIAPAKIIKSGKCGDNVTYTLDENGVLTIAGYGAIQDFGIPLLSLTFDTPWKNKRKTISTINIQFGVTRIGKAAFYECKKLIRVSIPDSVTSIGDCAFSYCASLTSVNIPHGVTSIGKWAFDARVKLTSINIPDSVKIIEKSTFLDCVGLTSVNIPDSVIAIEDWAFKGCKRLASVSVPAKTKVEDNAFPDTIRVIRKIIKRGECGDNVTYTLNENGVLIISGKGAMRNFEWDKEAQTYNMPWQNDREKITLINIQSGVTSIGNLAFCGCLGLTSVNIPDSVTSIGHSAFTGCAELTSVRIPESVTAIEYGVFYACAGLKSVSIPEKVTLIGECAFTGCTELTNVSIPDSVTSIEYAAFRNCDKLTSVSVPVQAKIDITAFPDTVLVMRRK